MEPVLSPSLVSSAPRRDRVKSSSTFGFSFGQLFGYSQQVIVRQNSKHNSGSTFFGQFSGKSIRSGFGIGAPLRTKGDHVTWPPEQTNKHCDREV